MEPYEAMWTYFKLKTLSWIEAALDIVRPMGLELHLVEGQVIKVDRVGAYTFSRDADGKLTSYSITSLPGARRELVAIDAGRIVAIVKTR